MSFKLISFDLDDTRKLLGNLTTEMEGRNPTCLGEVMAHVRKQGVTDVREARHAAEPRACSPTAPPPTMLRGLATG